MVEMNDALTFDFPDPEYGPRARDGQAHDEKENAMPLARVVTFDGVNKDRVEEIKQQISEGRPDEIPASEIVMLYDADEEKSVVILFFDNEDDYGRADSTLSAMPTDETPGRRTSVGRYEVAVRATG